MSELIRTQYLEAAGHFTAERWEECLQLARYNLTDPTLSRYYRMKNLLLVAAAETDWYEGERCRRAIDQLLYTANRLCDSDNEAEQNALRGIREDLAKVTKQLEASAPDEIDEDMIYGEDEEDDFDDDDSLDAASETDVYGDDPAAVRAAELEVFGDDLNIAAMYERADAAGRAAREAREREEEESRIARMEAAAAGRAETKEEGVEESLAGTTGETKGGTGPGAEESEQEGSGAEQSGRGGKDTEGPQRTPRFMLQTKASLGKLRTAGQGGR